VLAMARKVATAGGASLRQESRRQMRHAPWARAQRAE
jgi:hypothetical protein